MSNHTLRGALVIYRRLVAELCPYHCWFCHARGMTFQDLCQSCGNDLPRIAQSCRLCATDLVVGDLCGRCLQNPPPWDRAGVPLRYELPVDYLVQRFKYSDDSSAGKLCGSLLSAALPTDVQGHVVAVPMHRKRYIQRGFNHSGVLARDVSTACQLPLAKIARRTRHTDPQVGLAARDRRRNLRVAFAVSPAHTLGQPLILVDDILTTGETLRSLTLACKHAGYGVVTILCLARAGRVRTQT